ncbi:hypothetical protein [uncultured Cohaesibacter sp.]|uniref:hypothetical protein n=1 Tax=uncultured Cohaesibacter sp. TaxID=1002546 RepID=UPI00292F67CA|nr:hypothetical protein [uncultured Cohaesibacter sp.]
MKKIFKTFLCCFVLVGLSACVPAKISGQKPDKTKISLLFYPGGVKLDDLVVFDGKTYFGKVDTLKNDPVDDLRFTLTSGEIFIGQCTAFMPDEEQLPKCMEYEVYQSDREEIPIGTNFYRPRWF